MVFIEMRKAGGRRDSGGENAIFFSSRARFEKEISSPRRDVVMSRWSGAQ